MQKAYLAIITSYVLLVLLILLAHWYDDETPTKLTYLPTANSSYPYPTLYQHPLQDHYNMVLKSPSKLCKSTSGPKLLVIYNYFDNPKRPEELENINFFIHHAVERFFDIDEGIVDYYFIINGRTSPGVQFPDLCNVYIIQKDNSMDFCSYSTVLGGGLINLQQYHYFLFILPNVLGPILPTYWSESWWKPFIYKLESNPKIKLVGPYLSCEVSPHIQGVAFATDMVGLQMISTMWGCGDHDRTVYRSEVGQSGILLQEGYYIASLLHVYDGMYFDGGMCNMKLNSFIYGIGREGYMAQFAEVVFVRRGKASGEGRRVYEEYVRQAEFGRKSCGECWKARGDCDVCCEPPF